jgi:hypothetical protein
MENILKKVFVYNSHHEAIEAWEKIPGCNLLSFDYHTDTHPAFLKYSYFEARKKLGINELDSCNEEASKLQEEVKRQLFEEYMLDKNITRAINKLAYDEHIDFSISTNIIHNAYILCKQDGGFRINDKVIGIDRPLIQSNGKRIFEYSPVCIPICKKTPHDDECIKLLADNAINDVLLNDVIQKFMCWGFSFSHPFILDFDCDYFNTKESLNPVSWLVIRELIKRSVIITIALEENCVEDLRLEGEDITSTSIHLCLIKMITKVLREEK